VVSSFGILIEKAKWVKGCLYINSEHTLVVIEKM